MARLRRFSKWGFFQSPPEPPLPSRETELGELFFDLKEEVAQVTIETPAHQELVDNINQDLSEALKPLAVAEEGQRAEQDAKRILGRATRRLQDWQVMQEW